MPAATFARMSPEVKAKCYGLRNPGGDAKPMPFNKIRKLVRKLDGKRPSEGAIREAVANFKNTTRKKAGRPKGWRKTTKEEDKVIMASFHKVRPAGHGVDARTVHKALPKKVKKKISKRTVIRRLAEKGYTPKKKLNKFAPNEALKRKRLAFCRKHADKTANQWKGFLQGAADLKDYTF